MATQYAHSVGSVIIAEYTEAESGKNSNRPEIARAIAHARSSNSILYIACLDRLARNVYFISGLMESKLDFVVGDMPYATRFTIHILAAVAEEEGRRISERTKKGLEQAKLKGVKLGSQNEKWRAKRVGNPGLDKARVVSAKTRAEAMNEFYSFLVPIIKEMKDAGSTLRQIADHLNSAGHLTRALNPYNESMIHRLAKRYT
jgi:DNA invertase Pin-like site-specific DNA recombinase